MYQLVSVLNEISKEVNKQDIDNNPYMNYFQKAYAKAIIDGKGESHTFIYRIKNIFLNT